MLKPTSKVQPVKVWEVSKRYYDPKRSYGAEHYVAPSFNTIPWCKTSAPGYRFEDELHGSKTSRLHAPTARENR